MTAPALAALMWKLMTHPDFGILSYLLTLIGITDFKWASDPSTALLTVVLVDVWVYTPFIMILLLAGLRSLPKAALRGGSARRRAAQLRVLPHHAAHADALHHHRHAVPPARLDPAVRHHLCDDAGRSRRQAAGLPGPGLSRLLPGHQCRPVGGAHDHPLGDHLCALQCLHQAMAASCANARMVRGRPWTTHHSSNASSAAS